VRARLVTGLLVAGIILLGLNLRAAITSLPPVFPELASSLRLSATSLGMLASVPVLCFAMLSVPAGVLGRRFGEEPVLMAAVVLLTAGLLLRGAEPVPMLFPGTVLAGAAIAAMNVLLPSLVKRRRPDRAGLLIGTYLLMLSLGQVISTAIAVPVLRAAGGGSHGAGWPVRLTLGLWALPAGLAAVVWLPQFAYASRQRRLAGLDLIRAEERTRPLAVLAREVVPRQDTAAHYPVPHYPVPRHPVPRHAAPGWADRWAMRGILTVSRQPLAWQVAAFVGVTGVLFYAPLSWLPTLLQSRGMSAAGAGGVLSLMNVGNALSAVTVPVLAHRATHQRHLVAVTATAVAAGLCGMLLAPVSATAAPAVLLGLGQGAGLGLGTYFMMARAPDPATAASLSGFAQSIGYLVAAIGPAAVSFLHTAAGGWAIPVVTLAGLAAAQLWSGWLAGRARTLPVTQARPRPQPRLPHPAAARQPSITGAPYRR
jgi:MFS transporter, CP family, cyanate transporter